MPAQRAWRILLAARARARRAVEWCRDLGYRDRPEAVYAPVQSGRHGGGDVVMRSCPECGRFTVEPHCELTTCVGQWCSSGYCGWESAVSCDSLPIIGSPAYPEKVQSRCQLEPVVVIGTFTQSMFGGRNMVGWIFEHTGAPEWTVNGLYDFITGVLASIQALPGESTW